MDTSPESCQSVLMFRFPLKLHRYISGVVKSFAYDPRCEVSCPHVDPLTNPFQENLPVAMGDCNI